MYDEHTLQQEESASFTTKLFTNPVIRRLGTISDRAQAGHSATYGGIAAKTIFFLLMTLAGVAFAFVMPAIPFFARGAQDITVEGVTAVISMQEMVVVLIAGLFTLLTPFLAWIIRPTIPVTGTLYSFSQGFLLSWSINTFLLGYEDLAMLALGITVLIVLVMALLYASRIIKVNHKFKAVLSVLFFTSVIASLAVWLCSLFPATAGIARLFTGNPIISIVGSVIGIVIAALFLLSDFDTVEKTVEHNLPKKYEWAAAFGLVFTVIWLYLKVLNLLEKMSANKK